MGQNVSTHEGPRNGVRVCAPLLSAGLRGSDPRGPTGKEEQAAAGSTGGGLGDRGRRGQAQRPPGGVRPGREEGPGLRHCWGPEWVRREHGAPGRGPLDPCAPEWTEVLCWVLSGGCFG